MQGAKPQARERRRDRGRNTPQGSFFRVVVNLHQEHHPDAGHSNLEGSMSKRIREDHAETIECKE